MRTVRILIACLIKVQDH